MGDRFSVWFTIYTSKLDPEEETEDLVPMILGAVPAKLAVSMVEIPVGARVVNPLKDLAITVVQPSSGIGQHSEECAAFRKRLIELWDGWETGRYQLFAFTEIVFGDWVPEIVSARTHDGPEINYKDPFA